MSYVEDVINEFYFDDSDVEEDQELQEWVAEVNRYEINKNMPYTTVHEYNKLSPVDS